MRYFLNLFPTWRLEVLALLKLYFVSDLIIIISAILLNICYILGIIYTLTSFKSYTNCADFHYVAERN